MPKIPRYQCGCTLLPLVYTEKGYWPEEFAHQRMETQLQGGDLLIQ